MSTPSTPYNAQRQEQGTPSGFSARPASAGTPRNPALKGINTSTACHNIFNVADSNSPTSSLFRQFSPSRVGTPPLGARMTPVRHKVTIKVDNSILSAFDEKADPELYELWAPKI
ncbi:hypothetical protein FRB94_001323 [Tulasnella sp. JGI-2019a]|nr:hypothetical protein FRB94_001323 [Tulasnella sp. JGI-2019a]KAG9016897.1 hypothetical protein FRB93_009427 [Tulasnella sp. JGI-2019a]KAG9040207.1 hypothetical protein FRB95_000136 [Tulasnella sp. JGI-2019a]